MKGKQRKEMKALATKEGPWGRRWLVSMRFMILGWLTSGVLAFGEQIPEGFVSLFNGEDLSGWSGNPEHWSVADGCIVGTTDGSLKRNRFLTWTDGKVRNFELRAKVRITKGGNSGLQYRARMRPDLGEWVMSGYQSDVLPGHVGLNGMFYEEQGRRILGRTGEKVIVDRFGMPWVVGEMEVKDFPAGEWRDYRVLVQGNRHQHWIDGHQTADGIDDDVAGRALEGLLGIQVHVGPAMKVEYRDFWLKHLPDQLPMIAQEVPAESRLVKPQQPLPKNWEAPQRGELVAALAKKEIAWDELERKGFQGAHKFQVTERETVTHLRVWLGGDEEGKIVIDGEIAFAGKRVSPTWQLLEVPAKSGSVVSLEGGGGVFWAEPTLWKVEKKEEE